MWRAAANAGWLSAEVTSSTPTPAAQTAPAAAAATAAVALALPLVASAAATDVARPDSQAGSVAAVQASEQHSSTVEDAASPWLKILLQLRLPDCCCCCSGGGGGGGGGGGRLQPAPRHPARPAAPAVQLNCSGNNLLLLCAGTVRQLTEAGLLTAESPSSATPAPPGSDMAADRTQPAADMELGKQAAASIRAALSTKLLKAAQDDQQHVLHLAGGQLSVELLSVERVALGDTLPQQQHQQQQHLWVCLEVTVQQHPAPTATSTAAAVLVGGSAACKTGHPAGGTCCQQQIISSD